MGSGLRCYAPCARGRKWCEAGLGLGGVVWASGSRDCRWRGLGLGKMDKVRWA